MAKVIQAPLHIVPGLCPSVFLAGSIEMGAAENWQQQLISDLKGIDPLWIFNPRRDDWDSSWQQTKHNPQFREQVQWELSALEMANIIALYFDPNTRSPISLLELGLHAAAEKVICCCPRGFWRKGNVDIVCERHSIPVYEFYNGWAKHIKDAIDPSTAKRSIDE